MYSDCKFLISTLHTNGPLICYFKVKRVFAPEYFSELFEIVFV